MSEEVQGQHNIPIKQHAQKVSIRKVTLQSINPIVKKLEQHIGYLLQQTTQLRLSVKKVQTTASDHKIVHQKLDETTHRISQLQERVSDYNLYNNKKFLEIEADFNNFRSQTERIHTIIKKKAQQMKQLEEKTTLDNIHQTQKIQQNNKDILDTSIKLNIAIQDTNHTLENQQFKLDGIQRQIDLLTKRLETTSNTCSDNTSSLQLYLVDRQQQRQQRQKIWDKLLRAVEKQEYEYDKRVVKLQSQALKRDLIKNIDSVLTPQVKTFLPIMLQKIRQIQKLDAIISKVNQTSETVSTHTDLLEQHANKLQNFKQKTTQIDQTFFSYLNQMKQIKKQLSTDIGKHDTRIIKCDEKIKTVQSQANLHFKQNEELISTIQTKNKMELISVKQKINQDLSKFIDNHKEDIYKVVQQLVPQQQRKFQDYLRQVVPTIAETKSMLLMRCDQIQTLGQGLDKKIQAFSFKITKIKGDVQMLSNKILKDNSSIKEKIQENKNRLQLVGKILSEVSEIILVTLATSIMPNQQEVYVTYNDGIILEYLPNVDRNKMFYRKNKIFREQLKKAVLKSFIQSIDNILVADELQFLQWKKQKPSEYYQKQIVPIYKILEQSYNLEFKYAQKGSTSRVDKSSEKIDYQSNNQPEASKTIDFSQGKKKMNNNSLNQTTDFKKSYNVRLKKIDKTEKDRYNLSKQDIE